MRPDKSKLFFLLERTLDRCNLSEEKTPIDINQWQDFLNRINNSFHDFEQERYLLERSMEISSKEMVQLNQRFEKAEAIAHIGYWFYNPVENKILWSKETYRIFGLKTSEPVPPLEEVMQMVHEEDRPLLSQLIDRAIKEGKDYEKEFRIHNRADKKIYWVYVKGHPYNEKNSNGYLLSGIIMDITERKKSEEDSAKLNNSLIALSRQAGMSEVASSVLHNVGNILNSANISILSIQELIKNSDMENLIKVSQLINDNLPKNPDFLSSDEKGKLIPGYLDGLAADLTKEYKKIDDEITNLVKHIQHLKDIVVMQKDISGISGVTEKLFIPEVIDLAIKMGCNDPEQHGIQIIKKYEYSDYILIDKSRLLQILVNLIKNSKDSLKMDTNNHQKKLSISSVESNSFVNIIVEDNGVGILEENLLKIFTMGFTTKVGGHGFGLHSSAIAAKELGGDLSAVSKGKGARFILTLPEKK